jgi:putative oxidoreductase
MGSSARFLNWNHAHQSYLLLLVRVALGVILLVKGIFFISHAQLLKELILESRFAAGVGFLAAYTTFAHLFGGVFLILGLLTRWAAVLQLPVLLGAIFFILPEQELRSDFALSIIVLILLILVLIKGAGEFSMDAYLKSHLL